VGWSCSSPAGPRSIIELRAAALAWCFLDLKFHDIPAHGGAVGSAARLGGGADHGARCAPAVQALAAEPQAAAVARSRRKRGLPAPDPLRGRDRAHQPGRARSLSMMNWLVGEPLEAPTASTPRRPWRWPPVWAGAVCSAHESGAAAGAVIPAFPAGDTPAIPPREAAAGDQARVTGTPITRFWCRRTWPGDRFRTGSVRPDDLRQPSRPAWPRASGNLGAWPSDAVTRNTRAASESLVDVVVLGCRSRRPGAARALQWPAARALIEAAP